MRILLIKPKHIGDSLILTPTIAAIKVKYPQAEVDVVVRKGCEGILVGCPQISRILTVSGVEKGERKLSDLFPEIKLRLWLLTQKYDYVFELGDGHRARGLVLFCRGGKTFSVKPATPFKSFWRKSFDGVANFDWQLCHRVEKDFYTVAEFLPLDLPAPPMVFEADKTRPWKQAETLGRFSMMHIGCRQKINRWTDEGWVTVGRRLLELSGNLILSTGPASDELETAERAKKALGPGVICTDGKTTWPEMAWLLRQCDVFVTVNTAAMHLAAACQTPAVALLGPSIEDHWRPWRAPHKIVCKPGFTYTPGAKGFAAIKQRPMGEIAPREVIAACEEFINLKQSAKARPSFQRKV